MTVILISRNCCWWTTQLSYPEFVSSSAYSAPLYEIPAQIRVK